MFISDIQNIIRESDTYKELKKYSEDQYQVLLNGLIGSAMVFYASELFKSDNRPYVFIVEDKEKAAFLYNDLENYNPELKDKKILFYPASYKRPYQIEKTDNANVLLRTKVLSQLGKSNKNIMIITYPEAINEKVVSKKKLKQNIFNVKLGEELSIDFLNEFLISQHFEKVDYVIEPGQFAVRGGIVDVYSFSQEYPFRIDFWDDKIDSIRSFKPEDQLSIKTHNQVTITPNIQKELLQEERVSFFEFLPNDTKYWVNETDIVVNKIKNGKEKAKLAYEKLENEVSQLTPEQLYIDETDIISKLSDKNTFYNGKPTWADISTTIDFDIKPQPAFNKNFDLLANHLKELEENDIQHFFLSSNPKQIERIYAIFDDRNDDVNIQTLTFSIKEGFIDNQLKKAFYTDHQLFERYYRFRLKEGFQKTQEAITLKELYNLQKGDYVIHSDHGVGQFSGLELIDANGKQQEAIRLIYQGTDVLYVSIHSLHKISRYSGKEGREPKLNKLGSPAWKKLKQKTKTRVKKLAFDLISLYAKRKLAKGFQFSPDTYLQNELEASFMYEDTPDQLKTTLAVKADMEQQTPMDRLVCGDVGFGKTEIAIRAAFKAVADGKQVAILVPTTVLSFQHYKSFSKRLKDFPCNVSYINRFKTSKENRNTIEALERGEIDIIIGTHKLIGKEIKFRDLGLLIIDEEQKFGVSVKEKLKTLKENIDTLTLTATPIPRTLQFSLMGARDLSIMKTAPPNRQPVQTELHTFNEELIRDAVIYETQRGGQVFFVHNKVQNIKEVAGMIQRLCPDIRIAIGHGQMEGKKLESVMLDFIDGVYDVLVATTIIESGIDVPNANTIIINNANNFGLSDLHQLRGRVGRSNKKAFCYLIAPPPHMLSDDARKRLQAIEQFSDIGAGFNIAMRDLDIRGAGDLLGPEQSGFINEIGFETYKKILQETIDELKENEFKEVFADGNNNSDSLLKSYVNDVQIETDLELLIPNDYVNNVNERLSLYQELSEIETDEELINFENELKDRFGNLPEATRELLSTIPLRNLAKDIGIEKLIIKSQKMIAQFVSDAESPYYQTEKFTQVLRYIQQQPMGVTMSEKNNKLRLIYQSVTSISEAITGLSEITQTTTTV